MLAHAMLIVPAGGTSTANVSVAVEGAAGEPLVRVGLKSGQTPVKINGRIKQGKDGTFTLPAGGPWGWITVGPGGRPMRALEALRSLTICGWARPVSLQTGRGGNRIAFNLNYNKAGFDLVHQADGRLRLAVNQWPDRVRNDSSPGKLRPGEWVFFAVTYDAAMRSDNVRWYFGGPKTPAALDRTTSHAAGPTGRESGPLTIGNYNTTIHRHGTDRQFRGQLHAVQIFGSRTGSRGALSAAAIRKLQADPAAVPDFNAPAPKAEAAAAGSANPTDAAVDAVDTPVPPAGTRPRIIATTDGEIDDRCSMVRFLLYANEWDIEGIIYSSSKFHWDGHGWAGTKWIEEDIAKYATFHDKLKKHAAGFPTPKELKAKTYIGNISKVGAMDKDTPGSDRIVAVLLDDKPGPVYLQAWGGTNTIARALWKIQHRHPDRMKKVARKAIVYIILDQDTTFRKYIQPNWPDLMVLGSFRQFGTIAYNWRRQIPRSLHKHFDVAWMRQHILRGHGPLCARYEAHPKQGFRSEGDSPAFLHQIRVGLRSLEHPGYGGWGGRFVQEGRSKAKNTWRGARDDGDGSKPIWRWAEAFQNDWAVRADWCVKSVADANHPPKPQVIGPLDRTVKPGEKVTLSAAGSIDPDGDKLTHKWWRYDDVDTATTKIEIAGATTRTGASFVVPDEPGKTIHVILEVTDDGDPPLTRYQRVIFTVAAAQAAKKEGRYAIVVSKATRDKPAWKKVVDALVAKHGGEVVVYDASVTESLAALKKAFPRLPRYACFVATPAEAGRKFVADVHQLTRKLDDDPYTDVFWGILTGYDAANALRIAQHAEPLVVRRVASGTEVALEMCHEGLWYCELKQNRMVRKRPGGKPVEEKGPDDTTKALVDTLNEYKAQLFVTSGHATTRDWQIGYRYRNGSFRCKDGRLYGRDTKQQRHDIDSPNPKVYLPVGNCLMGHVDSRDAMALAWLNSAGVMQMVGYTVPTWFGYGGWGCLDYFLEQPGRYTLTEAFFANHHALVHRLAAAQPGRAAADRGPRRRSAARGFAFDRDVVAFYGDPAWEARMAKAPTAWDQTLTEKDGRFTFEILPQRGENTFRPINTNGSQRGWRPIVAFLPGRFNNVHIIEGADLKPVVADDFLLIPNPRTCDPKRAYKVVFTATRIR